jgi:hypothetical protein
MTQPLPIACTLGAADLEARLAELRALGADALVSVSETEPGSAVLRFRADRDVARRVDAVVAAEAQCCAFLDFHVEHGDEATVVTIVAPDGAAEIVRELAGAFSGR